MTLRDREADDPGCVVNPEQRLRLRSAFIRDEPAAFRTLALQLQAPSAARAASRLRYGNIAQ
jgi:hypothetical protein